MLDAECRARATSEAERTPGRPPIGTPVQVAGRGGGGIVPILLTTIISVIIAATASAANPRHPYNRPTITISPASFIVSYGKTTKLCVTVTPPRKSSLFMNPSVWRNSMGGVFSITPGTDPACTGSGKVSLTVLSLINDVCESKGGALAVLNNQAVAPATEGTVLIPDRESATRISDNSAIGLIQTEWRVTFSNSGGSATFDGLEPAERTFISPGDLNTCEVKTGADDPLIDQVWSGPDALANNSLIDANTLPASPTRTCSSVVSQVFHIGACTVPRIGTPIKLTFKFVNGTPTFTRSDAGGP